LIHESSDYKVYSSRFNDQSFNTSKQNKNSDSELYHPEGIIQFKGKSLLPYEEKYLFRTHNICNLKTLIKFFLQRTLGFKNYLYIFSLFIIKKLSRDKNEKDFIFFLNLLPDKGVVLDIGANIGVMSYYLAKEYPERVVFAFEPIPYNFQNLKKISEKFSLHNIKPFQLALGDENGTIEMVMPVKKSVRFHGLAHVKHKDIEDNTDGVSFECPIQRLDDFNDLKNISSEVTGIKIDVENFEYHVLRGSENMLRKYMPVIYCELWDNANRTNTMDYLKELGYKVKMLENNRLREFDPKKHSSHNFFFVKE
jgi:FkbM family methyltransferase